jgi:biopolymer transport protein ExbD
MRRRRKRRSPEGIELNLAAMLDMAFQLLMFFILTFNPGQLESQFAAYLPAPKPLTKPTADSLAVAKTEASPAEALIVTVAGSAKGQIETLAVGGRKVADLASLNTSVHNAIFRGGDDCDQVTVQVSANLRYEELMQVVDICTKQELPSGGKLAKLKLVELQPE